MTLPFLFLKFISWILQLVIALLLIREGSLSHSMAWINLGYLGILVGILVRYFDFFADRLNGGLSLIFTGVLILFLIYVLNRGRQSVIQKVKETV